MPGGPADPAPPDEAREDDAPLVGEATLGQEGGRLLRAAASQASKLPRIAGVELSGELARGGMGSIYEGVQTALRRRVAVKVMTPESRAASAVTDRRFQREARLLANLKHPHIVACYEAGMTDEGTAYLIMELVGGPDLAEWIDRHGPLAEADAVRVVRALASALEHARRAGVIHRDVKAANVLLEHLDDEEDIPAPGNAAVAVSRSRFPFVPKLSDLGLARTSGRGSEDTATTDLVGTPRTMSPEQFDDPKNVDHRTDIYGLGCVLYHALTGQGPFADARTVPQLMARKAQLAPDPGEVREELSAAVVALTRAMLAPRRADRLGSYADIIAACDAILSGEVPRLPSASSGSRRGARVGGERRNRVAWIAGAAVLGAAAALLAVGWAVLREPPPEPVPAPDAAADADPATATPAGPVFVDSPPPPLPRLEPARPLLAGPPDERLRGWKSLRPGVWRGAEDGPGAVAAGTGGLRHPLPRDRAWVLAGALRPAGEGEGRTPQALGARLELADGRAITLLVQLTGVRLVSVQRHPDHDAPYRLDDPGLAPVTVPAEGDIPFRIERVADHLRLALLTGATPGREADLLADLADVADPLAVRLFVEDGVARFPSVTLAVEAEDE